MYVDDLVAWVSERHKLGFRHPPFAKLKKKLILIARDNM